MGTEEDRAEARMRLRTKMEMLRTLKRYWHEVVVEWNIFYSKSDGKRAG